MTKFAHNQPVPTQAPDRGESGELEEALMSVLAEYGFQSVEEYARRYAQADTLDAVRAIMAAMLFPDGRTVEHEAMIIGYAIGLPGLPSMRKSAVKFRVSHEAMSKAVKKLRRDWGLPRSHYEKTETACETYVRTNARRRKNG